MNDISPIVFVVDDDPDVLKSLARVLRSAGLAVATFSSPSDFLEQHDPRAAGCLVLDGAMPGLNGLELQQALTAKGSAIPIIFLTGRGDIPMSVNAMKAGAVDFLPKPVKDSDLLSAIKQALADADADHAKRDALAGLRKRMAKLTPRENQVMALVVRGNLNKQIAFLLGTVEKTIKVHRARVMRKMEVNSVAELVRIAEKIGMPAHEELER